MTRSTRLVATVLLSFATACAGGGGTGTKTERTEARVFTAAELTTIILQPSEAPGATTLQADRSGPVTAEDFWLEDLATKLTELGFTAGRKNLFDVGPEYRKAGSKLSDLPEGVLYASSQAALFRDAAAAKLAVGEMKTAMVASLRATPGNEVSELGSPALSGGAEFALNTYLKRFTDWNAQRVWSAGNAVFTIVVVGTEAADAKAQQLAELVSARTV